MDKFFLYFLLFIIYSFIGWCIEVVNILFHQKKFVNRGFLLGPLCPIYGYSSILMIFLLQKYKNDLVALFLMAILICSLIEYFTSLIMEKIFHARWWDYSNKKFNINGRICLETMIPFGLLGILLIKVLNPFIIKFLKFIPSKILLIITIILLIIYIIDNIITFSTMSQLHLSKLKFRTDNTEEITKKIRNILMKKPLLIKRLVKAFPNMKIYKKRVDKK